MDNIDRIMKEADRLGYGVSYGKYRAAYPNGSRDVVPKPAPSDSPEKPAAICRHCGKEFVKNHANQAYCSAECGDAVKTIRQNEWRRNKNKKDIQPIACAECGAEFSPAIQRKKYCCPKCAAAGKRKQQHLWYAAHKKGSQ